MYYNAPTYIIDKNEWTTTSFKTRGDVVTYIDSKFHYPSEYHLKYTNGYWNEQGSYWQKNGNYPLHVPKSLDFKNHWNFEKTKCDFEGFIIYRHEEEGLEYALPCLFYWYLNYCVIYDKVKQKLDLPEIYDGDYHYFLYILRCILHRKFGVVLKKRQARIYFKKYGNYIKCYMVWRCCYYKNICF